MTLDTLIFSVGVLGALQAGYVLLKRTEARTADGPAMYESSSESFFLDTDEDKSARSMKKDFDLARAKSIMATANEFATPRTKA